MQAQLYLFPHDAAAPALLGQLAAPLGVAAPALWDYTLLHRLVGELVIQRVSVTVNDAVQSAAIAGLPTSVVVLAAFQQPELQQFVQHCRAAGFRPIFAMLTRPALEMSLAVWLEHLLEDRRREQARARRPPANGPQLA